MCMLLKIDRKSENPANTLEEIVMWAPDVIAGLDRLSSQLWGCSGQTDRQLVCKKKIHHYGMSVNKK